MSKVLIDRGFQGFCAQFQYYRQFYQHQARYNNTWLLQAGDICIAMLDLRIDVQNIYIKATNNLFKVFSFLNTKVQLIVSCFIKSIKKACNIKIKVTYHFLIMKYT